MKKYLSLLLGTRFKYEGGTQVWVILSHYGPSRCGLVARWSDAQSPISQGICSAEDSEEKLKVLEVEVVD